MSVDLKMLLAQSFTAAKVTWSTNAMSSGGCDENTRVTVLSNLAITLFIQATTDVEPIKVREFLSGFKST